MTTVLNMITHEEKTYSLPPGEAVQAAHEQGKGNWKTWEYTEVLQNPEVVFGRFTVTCGNWCCLLEAEKLEETAA